LQTDLHQDVRLLAAHQVLVFYFFSPQNVSDVSSFKHPVRVYASDLCVILLSFFFSGIEEADEDVLDDDEFKDYPISSAVMMCE
jgi:hypothetical protein